MSVSAGDDQREHGKFQVSASALFPLEENGMDVAFQMIDGDERFFQSESKRFGKTDSYQQGSGEAWALRDGDGVDRFVGGVGFGDRLSYDRHNCLQVLTRSEFGNYSAVRLVRRDLGRDNVR